VKETICLIALSFTALTELKNVVNLPYIY
jgi:hypothetical protein